MGPDETPDKSMVQGRTESETCTIKMTNLSRNFEVKVREVVKVRRVR